jgi:hypothetical protein
MTAPARFTQADLKRAAAGVRAAGLPVSRVEVDRDGRIAVIVGEPVAEKARDNPLDRIFDDAA